MVKNLPAIIGEARDGVQSLGGKDPLEQEMVPHSSILAGIPRAEEPGRLQSMGPQRGRHDRATEHRMLQWTSYSRGQRLAQL